ncbi:hydroxylysine kinase-like isoform X4 [Cheilinus undulatus]|uniref:hydroxylysine kinase-like isoform X4 n=1 Tax=Cheilinus undulatus TaxID=241271 RepID=UPI001BD5BF3D|nr:hydroxylysine kinase-like isoform X4 [Cheilinus undulatus]
MPLTEVTRLQRNWKQYSAVMAAQHVKPNFSQPQVAELVKRLFGLTPSEIRPLPSYDDQNFYVAAGEGGEFVLKIMNSEDSKEPKLIEMQTYAMSFLQQNGLPAQTALPTTSGQLMSLEEMDCGYGCQKYLVRLLTYLPGTTISEMEHPHLEVLQRDNFNGSLSYIPLLEKCTNLLDGDPLQEVINSVIHQFKTIVISKQPNFRKCEYDIY